MRYSFITFTLLVITCGGLDDDLGNGGDTAGSSRALRPAQLTVDAWSFVPIAGMACADGSATGIGVNLASPPSDGLLIYLEGGGGCWSAATCKDAFHIENANLNGFDATTLQEMLVTGSSRYVPAVPPNRGATGLWDRAAAANPFRNYDYVYIPYCTADFHEGNAPHSPIDGLSHVGFANMTHALAALSETFTPSRTRKVVLSGSSAGGFGALWNFPQTQEAFAAVPVSLIAESGPPLPSPYLSASLEELWRVAWGLDGTKPAAAPSTRVFPYLQWLAQAYPHRKLGLIDVTGDVSGALFLGIPLLGASSLSSGLFSVRQQLQQTAQGVSFFLVPSLLHSYLHLAPATWPAPGPPYGNGSLPMGSWMAQVIN